MFPQHDLGVYYFSKLANSYAGADAVGHELHSCQQKDPDGRESITSRCHSYTYHSKRKNIVTYWSYQTLSYEGFDTTVNLTSKLYVHLTLHREPNVIELVRTGSKCNIFEKKMPGKNPCSRMRGESNTTLAIFMIIAIILLIILFVLFVPFVCRKKGTNVGGRESNETFYGNIGTSITNLLTVDESVVD